MAEALCTYIENDRPFLGICLGLQLLFESSEENGPGQCLTDIFSNNCVEQEPPNVCGLIRKHTKYLVCSLNFN